MTSTIRALLATTAALTVASSVWAEDRALLVGVGTYGSEYPFRSLDGIHNDIETMRDVVRHLGFDDQQVRVLEDEEATYAGILLAFDELIEAVGPEDRALFYFSGHGYHVPDRDGDEDDQNDEVLVPHDYGGTAERLTNVLVDDQIAGLIDRVNTDDVLVFLDACHSGTATKGLGDAGGWTFFDEADAEWMASKGEAGGYMALSSSRDEEQSLMAPGGGVSFFTAGVGRAAREAVESAGSLTMNGIREVALREIERLHAVHYPNRPQAVHHPVLTGNLARADDNLLGRRSSAGLGRRSSAGGASRTLWSLVNASIPDTSRRVALAGTKPVYQQDDLLEVEFDMPVDGYLYLLQVVEGADEATLLFPNAWSRGNRFDRDEGVRVPDVGDYFDLPLSVEGPTEDEERNLLVAVVTGEPVTRSWTADDVVRTLRGADAVGTVRYVIRR